MHGAAVFVAFVAAVVAARRTFPINAFPSRSDSSYASIAWYAMRGSGSSTSCTRSRARMCGAAVVPAATTITAQPEWHRQPSRTPLMPVLPSPPADAWLASTVG